MAKELIGSIQGPSAYDIAVFEGFVGTEEQWLASLVGDVTPAATAAKNAAQTAASAAEGARADAEAAAASVPTEASIASAITSAVAPKANSASPAFTGTPTGITKAHVGLGSVDNTSDAAKPVSIAQALALSTKMDKTGVTKGLNEVLSLRFGLSGLAIQNVVILGSSTSNGAHASNMDHAYTSRMSRHLHAAYPLDDGAAHPPLVPLASALTSGRGIQFVNAAVGNTTSVDYCDATKRAAVGALNPALVVHMIGSNDYYYGTTPDAYYTNVKAAIAGINAAKSTTQPIVHVLVNSYARRDSVPTMTYPYNAYRDKMIQIAAESNGAILFIDVAPVFAAAGLPTSDPYGLLPDNVHTNDHGHKIIADVILDALGIRGRADGGVQWKDLTLAAGFIPRTPDTLFQPQYLMLGGVMYLRGGVQRTPTANFIANNTSVVATLPSVAYGPERQRTFSVMGSTGDGELGFVSGVNIQVRPNDANQSFIMLDGMMWPLTNQ